MRKPLGPKTIGSSPASRPRDLDQFAKGVHVRTRMKWRETEGGSWKRCRQGSLRLFRQQTALLGDNAEHHLVGTATDRSEAPVAIAARHQCFIHISHAAPELQTRVVDFSPQLCSLEFRH